MAMVTVIMTVMMVMMTVMMVMMHVGSDGDYPSNLHAQGVCVIQFDTGKDNVCVAMKEG